MIISNHKKAWKEKKQANFGGFFGVNLQPCYQWVEPFDDNECFAIA